MPRAANDVMQSIIFSAILDGVAALKRASGGLPNQLLRDVQAIHPNVTFADLPKELQDQIAESTRAAFTQLLKEGYAVGPRQQMQQSRPMDRVPERQRPTDRRGPPRGPRRGPPGSEGGDRGLADPEVRRVRASPRASLILGGQPRPGSDQQRRRHDSAGLLEVCAHPLLESFDLNLLGRSNAQCFELRDQHTHHIGE